MKRVAIPMKNEMLSEQFGACTYYKVYDIIGDRIRDWRLELPVISEIRDLPAWISANGITDLITHRVERSILTLFNVYKINLYIGVRTDDPDRLVREFIKGRMVSDKSIINEIIENNL